MNKNLLFLFLIPLITTIIIAMPSNENCVNPIEIFLAADLTGAVAVSCDNQVDIMNA